MSGLQMLGSPHRTTPCLGNCPGESGAGKEGAWSLQGGESSWKMPRGIELAVCTRLLLTQILPLETTGNILCYYGLRQAIKLPHPATPIAHHSTPPELLPANPLLQQRVLVDVYEEVIKHRGIKINICLRLGYFNTIIGLITS